MLRVKGEKAEFLTLVDEMEQLVERRLKGQAPLSAEEIERLEEIERELTGHILLGQVPDDRRRGVRLVCRVRVQVRALNEARAAVVIDIGSGGVFVQTEWALPPGTEVELVVDQGLGALERGTLLSGQVAWASDPDDHRPGVGVAFRNPDPVSEARVRALLIELLRQQSSVV